MLESVLQYFGKLVELHPKKELVVEDGLSPPTLVDATLDNIKDGTISSNKQHKGAFLKSFSAFNTAGVPWSGLDTVFGLLKEKVHDDKSLILGNGQLICSAVVCIVSHLNINTTPLNISQFPNNATLFCISKARAHEAHHVVHANLFRRLLVLVSCNLQINTLIAQNLCL